MNNASMQVKYAVSADLQEISLQYYPKYTSTIVVLAPVHEYILMMCSDAMCCAIVDTAISTDCCGKTGLALELIMSQKA